MTLIVKTLFAGIPRRKDRLSQRSPVAKIACRKDRLSQRSLHRNDIQSRYLATLKRVIA